MLSRYSLLPEVSPVLPDNIRYNLRSAYNGPHLPASDFYGTFPLVYVVSEGRRFYGYLQLLPTGAIFHRPGLPYPKIKALNYQVLHWLS